MTLMAHHFYLKNLDCILFALLCIALHCYHMYGKDSLFLASKVYHTISSLASLTLARCLRFTFVTPAEFSRELSPVLCCNCTTVFIGSLARLCLHSIK